MKGIFIENGEIHEITIGSLGPKPMEMANSVYSAAEIVTRGGTAIVTWLFETDAVTEYLMTPYSDVPLARK